MKLILGIFFILLGSMSVYEWFAGPQAAHKAGVAIGKKIKSLYEEASHD